MRAIVLTSGGLDSSTCLAIATRRDGFEAHTLSFDYGQRQRSELEAAERIARELGAASHRCIRIDLAAFGGSSLTDPSLPVPKDRSDIGAGPVPSTYVPARNTVFLSLGLALAEVLEARSIYIGISSVDSSGYPDCSPAFLEAFRHLARTATVAGNEGKGPRIEAPLLHLSKAETIRLGSALGVDYRLTRSCYDPPAPDLACGHCDACLLRRKGFEEAGVPDPTQYA